jgi:hypothetical protein
MTILFRRPIPKTDNRFALRGPLGLDRHAGDMIAPTAPCRKGRSTNTSGVGDPPQTRKKTGHGIVRPILLLPHFRQPPAAAT